MKPGILLVLLFSYCFAFSQDEVIERETMAAADFELKIVEIKNDTLYARSLGKIEKTPIQNVLAYRKNYKQGTKYIFPNGSDSLNFAITNGQAVKKAELKNSVHISPRDAREALLEPYITKAVYKKPVKLKYHYAMLN